MEDKEIKILDKFKKYVEETNILEINKQIILTSVNDFIEQESKRVKSKLTLSIKLFIS